MRRNAETRRSSWARFRPRWIRPPRTFLAPVFVALASLALYVWTLAPTVTSEDSGELITAAYHFGVPHPPGYPLWTMLCGAFIHVFAIGSVAWRANLFSALCAAAAVGVLCRCLMLLGIGRSIAAGASLTIAFGAVFWSQSVITEVYALHALVFTLMLWSILMWRTSDDCRWLVAASAVLGLGMCNHHTIGLSAIGLAAWVLLLRPRLILRWKLVLTCVAVFVCSLLPYTYLLAAARANPPVNWGEPRTFDDLVRHVGRKQYKTSATSGEDASTPTWSDRWRETTTVAAYCAKEHTVPLAVLGGIGLVQLALRRRRIALLLLLLTGAHVGLFLYLLGLGPSRQSVWSAKVFFIPQYMISAIPLAFGVGTVIETARRFACHLPLLTSWKPLRYSWCVVPILLAAPPLLANYRDNNYRHYWYAYDHAQNMLRSMLPNALIIPSGDHNTFPLIYVTLVEGVRPDVTIADKYGYIDPEIYTDMPGFRGRRPRTREERAQIEEWIVRHKQRPVYYTVKKESPVPNARQVSVGVLYHLLPETKALDRDNYWESIRYRNAEEAERGARDYGSDNIMADYEFFSALNALRVGHTDKALASFRRASEYGYGIKEISNNIGCALAEHGLIDEAIAYYRQSADLDPEYTSARWNLARIYKSAQNWSAAEGIFLELATISPNDFRVFGELGFIGKILGTPPDLIRHRFEESLRQNPSQPQIIQELASMYAQADQTMAAQDVPSESAIRGSGSEESEVSPASTAVVDAKREPIEENRNCVEEAQSEGPLVFDSLIWDFGEVLPRVHVSHDFTITNVGDMAVTITDMTRSCHCVQPHIPDAVIAPGETMPIGVTLRTAKRPKAMHQTVHLTTDAEEQRNITLTVTATVIPELEILPSRITIVETGEETVAVHHVELTHLAGRSFSILSVSSNTDCVTVVADLHEPAISHGLEITVDETGMRNIQQAEVLVTTDVASQREVRVPIRIRTNSELTTTAVLGDAR